MAKNSNTARERRLIEACEIVNADPEATEIEKEFDALTDEIADSWEDAADAS